MNNVIVGKLSLKNEDDLNQVANMIYNWWGREEGYDFTLIKELVSSYCNGGDFPTVVIAKINNIVVGCGYLISNDIPFRQDLFPVLSSLYVREEYRRMGIGSKIVNEIVSIARRNFKVVYLMTNSIGFYEKLGFEYVENSNAYIDTHNKTIIVNRLYKKDL